MVSFQLLIINYEKIILFHSEESALRVVLAIMDMRISGISWSRMIYNLFDFIIYLQRAPLRVTHFFPVNLPEKEWRKIF